MERRVVITGLGAVTPLGNDAPTSWAAVKEGTCGIGLITHFDTEAYKVKVAAEVKGFDPLEHGLTKQELRRNDPAINYALVASDEAVADAAGAAAIAAVAVKPGAADSTSEITVPMGASHDGAGEA